MISRYTRQTTDFTKANQRKGILNFDTDNLYPFHTENIVKNSGTVKTCVDIFGRFIYGRGFNNDLWNVKVGDTTADKLLRLLINDYKQHKGFAIWVGYNGLLEVTKLKYVPFMNCRLKAPDDLGYINKIKYSKSWKNSDRCDVYDYDVYNDDKEIIARQIAVAGGIDNWRGQIYYFGGNEKLEYPENSFNSVITDAITDIQISLGKNANAMTNFMPSVILELPYELNKLGSTPQESEDMKTAFLNNLENFQGYDNAGKYMLIENPLTNSVNGEMRKMEIHKLDMQNYDKIYEYTENSVMEKIRKAFMIPKILIDPVATGFSGEILNYSYNLYNEITSLDRQIFEEFANKFFGKFKIGDYTINPLKIIENDNNI